METWKTVILRAHVSEIQSKALFLYMSRALDSIKENIEFCSYHYEALENLIANHMVENTDSSYVKLRLTLDENILNNEYKFAVACKAHIIALIRTLHSLPDLMAHVIYFSLGLNLENETKPNKDKIDFSLVLKKLDNKPEYGDLLAKMRELTSNDEYKYLNRLGNNIKHKANIRPMLTYKLKEKGRNIYEFKFDAFEKYSERLALPFIEDEFKREHDLVICIGNCLNKFIDNS